MVPRTGGRTTYSGTRAVSLHVKSIASVGGVKPAFGADGASPDDRFPLAGTLRLEMRATFGPIDMIRNAALRHRQGAWGSRNAT